MNKTGEVRPRWIERHFIGVSSTLLVLFLITPYLITHMFVNIPAGHSGVLWLRFFGGTVMNFHYSEGMKVICPWDKIHVYDTRVKQRTDTFEVLANDGLKMALEVTVRFRLLPASLPVITRYAGADYVENLLIPSVAAIVRTEVGRMSAEEVYSKKRDVLETRVLDDVSRAINELIPSQLHKGQEIEIVDFRIRDVRLPSVVQTAIESKISQMHQAEQYKYILQREEQEKERKLIEAQGIKGFQDIVSSGISEPYLRWKGIDATLKLADSPNSKVVIIGGKEGLPVILGPLDSSSGVKEQHAQPPLPSSAAAARPASSSAAEGSSAVPSSSSAGAPPALFAPAQ